MYVERAILSALETECASLNRCKSFGALLLTALDDNQNLALVNGLALMDAQLFHGAADR